MSAQLFVVATPIGHLDDMTFRSIEVLKSVSLIAAEDTRQSAQLLKHYNISTPLTACHDHNESNKIDILIEKLKNGADIALVSDAGTPLISDPGFKLVRAAQAHDPHRAGRRPRPRPAGRGCSDPTPSCRSRRGRPA